MIIGDSARCREDGVGGGHDHLSSGGHCVKSLVVVILCKENKVALKTKL